MPGMNAWLALSLAFLLPAVGANAAGNTVTVHRCIDGKGLVTLQDDPCPKGSYDSTREMQRPKDPPPQAKTLPVAAPVIAQSLPPAPYIPPPPLIPPPPMYRCTSYDGIERFSESYDPNPRCEPFVLYYPYPRDIPPALALSCRWVEDSCVRLSDRAACARWREMKKEAASEVMRAFSDTAAYRKSELERLTQIVNEHCW